MCDALAIAGLALSAGSAAMNSMAASKVDKARSEALTAERIRQGRLDQEAEALNAQSRDRYQNFEEKQTEQAAEIGDYVKQQTTPEPAPAAALPVSQSNITVQEEGKQRADAREFTDAQGEALGNLRAFGDLLGSIGRDQARDAGYVGQVGGFKRGSSGVLPFELDAAGQAGNSYKMFGDILGGLGQVSSMAGASGVNPFGSLFGAGSPAVNTAAKSSALSAGGNMGGSMGGLQLGSLFGPAPAVAKSSARIPFG